MNILLADDEKIALDALSDAVLEAIPNAAIFSFRTGTEAIEKAKNIKIDVAFLDIEMWDMDGLELAKNLKEINSKTNIVFVTGYTEYAVDAFSLYVSGYLLKPVSPEKIRVAMQNLRTPLQAQQSHKLRIQCFGNFEVFCNGKVLSFPRKKSKELFAYLIDRRGAQVSMSEIASILWDDGEYSLSRNNQILSYLHDLVKTLEAVGEGDIIIRHRNATCVNVSKVDCDCYSCLNGDPAAINSYTGEYMSQYSWAEFTTGRLTKMLM